MTDQTIRRTELASNLRVVTESMPDVRSVAIGFWVDTGSRDEDPSLAGASHFLEHLLFKGTADRSALDIAEAVESVGGEMNAFTTKEYTAFYVRILDEHCHEALDILSDIIWSPAFRSDEVETERQVILEEIRMRDDAPDDLVHELFSEVVYPDHPLGREVLGGIDTIEAMSREQIAEFHGAHYRPESIVVAAAGSLVHDDIVERITNRFAGPAGSRPRREHGTVGAPAKRWSVLERPTEQAHLVYGMLAPISRRDPDRHACGVLNQVLGGGMASRLFQEIREKRGLAYSVYSYRAAYEETGMFAIYAGTAPAQAATVLDLIDEEWARLERDGTISERELAHAKGAIKGGVALSLEGSSSRMSRLGRGELTLNEIRTVDEMVADIDAVTLDDVGRVIQRLLVEPRVLAVVGPFADPEAFSARVA